MSTTTKTQGELPRKTTFAYQEDAVMLRLLSLDTQRAERNSYLKAVLPHVRWQFLSTEVLLKACRDRDVRNSCPGLTEAAFHWLLDSTAAERQQTRRKEVRRESYRADVAETRPSQRATQYLRSKVKVVLQTSHGHL